MFGFIGHPQIDIITEANGETASSTNRYFYPRLAAKSQLRDARLYFDIENVNPTKPAFQLLLNTTEVAYDGKPLARMPMDSQRAEASQRSGGGIYYPTFLGLFYDTEQRGWRYTSSAVLSPATRKYRTRINRPEGMIHFGWAAVNNNQGSSSASNQIRGAVTLNLAQFPNLNSFSIIESYISSLSVVFNKKLESIMLAECDQLTSISGKLPPSTKYVHIGQVAVTSVNTFLSEADSIITLFFTRFANVPNAVNATSTLTGTLEIAHLNNLQEFAIVNNSGLSQINLPTGKSDWRFFYIANQATASGPLSTTLLQEVLDSPTLQVFEFFGNNKTWAKSFGNSDISSVLSVLWLYGNAITGNFIKTDAQTAMKELRLGNSISEANRFATIDLSGFSGSGIVTLYLQGVECSNITLPASLPGMTMMQAYDNKFDIVTNSDIITKINGYTELQTLYLGFNTTSTIAANNYGQDSVNGLGANADLSGLSKLVNLSLAKCGLSGSLTLYNGNKIQNLYLQFNAISSLVNFTAHTGLQQILADSCTNLIFAITNAFTSLRYISIGNTKITSIDLSGRTSTLVFTSLFAPDCPDLTTVTFPATEATCVFNGGVNINFNNCTSLNQINNLDKFNYNVANNGTFNARSCALNMTLPFGASSSGYPPYSIDIRDNGMSTANVDATIMSIYNNKTKWNATTLSKVLNISGTNAAPSGIYQAPAVAGSPANANEAVYELVNTYGWTITTS